MRSASAPQPCCAKSGFGLGAAVRGFLVWLFGFVVLAVSVAGQTRQQFHTLSTTWARALGMGGAFVAVEDNLAALLYNPANFVLYRELQSHRLTFFVNPVGLAAALYRPEDLHGRREWRLQEIGTSLELLIRGAAFSTNSFELAALVGEESPSPVFAHRPDVFSTRHYSRNQYSLVAGRARFAGRVAIGGSLGVYYRDSPSGRRSGLGSSYGVTLLSSSNIRIGVSYWSFSAGMEDYRREPERIVNEAVNLGMAYKTSFGLLLAVDIRNLGEEARAPVREIHVGFEQKLLSWVAMRGGYFRDRLQQHNIITAGVGIIDQNLWRPLRHRFQEPDWAVNYALRFEQRGTEKSYDHALTFLIRL